MTKILDSAPTAVKMVTFGTETTVKVVRKDVLHAIVPLLARSVRKDFGERLANINAYFAIIMAATDRIFVIRDARTAIIFIIQMVSPTVIDVLPLAKHALILVIVTNVFLDTGVSTVNIVVVAV